MGEVFWRIWGDSDLLNFSGETSTLLASATNAVKANSAIIHTEETLLSQGFYSSPLGSALAPTGWGCPLSRGEIHLTPVYGSSPSISSLTSQGDS